MSWSTFRRKKVVNEFLKLMKLFLNLAIMLYKSNCKLLAFPFTLLSLVISSYYIIYFNICMLSITKMFFFELKFALHIFVTIYVYIVFFICIIVFRICSNMLLGYLNRKIFNIRIYIMYFIFWFSPTLVTQFWYFLKFSNLFLC